jgi:hypothetical protein
MRTLQRPPETEAHRPKEIEIGGGIAPVSISSKLGFRSLVDARLQYEEQMAAAFQPLRDALQRQHPPIHRHHPQ